MKKYNRPVVEINGFEVEDIITSSVAFSGEADANELQGVYNDYASGDAGSDTSSDNAIVFEW